MHTVFTVCSYRVIRSIFASYDAARLYAKATAIRALEEIRSYNGSPKSPVERQGRFLGMDRGGVEFR